MKIMKYIVYLTKNIVNNKIYIGVHGTETPDKFDNYIGNGVCINLPNTYQCRKTAFQCAVSKYGVKNFVRTTLRVFDTMEDALDLEALLVTRDFIERTDVYNTTIGGGMLPKLNKFIYQYDLEGNFIKKWDSIIAIINYYNVGKDRIRMVINDKRSFEMSYWSEVYCTKLDTKEFRPSSRGSIRQYTIEGILLKTFKNTSEASKALDIDRAKITSAIYDKRAIEGYWFLKEGETIESYLDGSIKIEPKVYQYDLKGQYIKDFENISAVKKSLKINKNDLRRAIKNNKSIGKYYWSYDKFDNLLLNNPEIEIKSPKKVYQYTLEGDFVKEWESITACKKEFPSVLQVCLGNRLHCHKFKFSFNKIS